MIFFCFIKNQVLVPPLILLHGNGENHCIFDELSKKLCNHFTLYAIDSRNHGQSSKTANYSYDAMMEDVHAFIQALSLQQANLIGFSDGAIVGLLLALKYGDCISRMALLGINLSPDDFTDENYQFIRKTYEKTRDPLFQMMLEQPSIKLDEVKSVKIPTLVVEAENDLFKPETFQNLVLTMPHATLLIMRRHTHDSYITGQDLLYPDLLHFFENT